MSKIKAVGHGILGAIKVSSAIGAVTGHGLASTVLAAARVRVPATVTTRYAKYQMNEAQKCFQKATDEWKKD